MAQVTDAVIIQRSQPLLVQGGVRSPGVWYSTTTAVVVAVVIAPALVTWPAAWHGSLFLSRCRCSAAPPGLPASALAAMTTTHAQHVAWPHALAAAEGTSEGPSTQQQAHVRARQHVLSACHRGCVLP